MIVYLKVEPGIAKIYQARAENLKTTMQELMESVLAFWPAAQWVEQPSEPQPVAQTDHQAETESQPETEAEPDRIEAPFGAGY